MNRLWRIYVFDMRKGFMENRTKIGIAVFVFLFLANVTVSESIFYSSLGAEGDGFLGYWMSLLGGMREYIRTDQSTFELPVSWLLFYAYLFYLVGFYPVADLYESGTKTLLLSESRNKWMVSKFLWISTMVVLYFLVFAACLFLNMYFLEGAWNLGLPELEQKYGIVPGSVGLWQILVIWMVLPVLMSIALSWLQFALALCTNAITAYCMSVILLVVSAYWMRPFLPANYLMMMRNRLLSWNGMKTEDGFVFGAVLLFLSIAAGCLVFRRKDIYKSNVNSYL